MCGDLGMYRPSRAYLQGEAMRLLHCSHGGRSRSGNCLHPDALRHTRHACVGNAGRCRRGWRPRSHMHPAPCESCIGRCRYVRTSRPGNSNSPMLQREGRLGPMACGGKQAFIRQTGEGPSVCVGWHVKTKRAARWPGALSLHVAVLQQIQAMSFLILAWDGTSLCTRACLCAHAHHAADRWLVDAVSQEVQLIDPQTTYTDTHVEHCAWHAPGMERIALLGSMGAAIPIMGSAICAWAERVRLSCEP